MLKNLNKYSKALVSLGGALTVTGQVLADGELTTGEAGIVITAFATAVGVFLKANGSSEA